MSHNIKDVYKRQVRTIALGFAAFIVFSYMYTRGISPVWAAVAIVCFRGFFRFLYRLSLIHISFVTN